MQVRLPGGAFRQATRQRGEKGVRADAKSISCSHFRGHQAYIRLLKLILKHLSGANAKGYLLVLDASESVIEKMSPTFLSTSCDVKVLYLLGSANFRASLTSSGTREGIFILTIQEMQGRN
jgi:hypothetical protein